jgi:hypothetical protein
MNEKCTLCERYGGESVEWRKGTGGIDVFKEADDFDRLIPCVRLSVDDVMFLKKLFHPQAAELLRKCILESAEKSHAIGRYDSYNSPRRTRCGADCWRPVSDHWNLAGPQPLSPSRAPRTIKQHADAYPHSGRRHTDCGL